MKVGDVVIAIKDRVLLTAGCQMYAGAIVVSLDPFVIMSENQVASWDGFKQSDFQTVCPAHSDVVISCVEKYKAMIREKELKDIKNPPAYPLPIEGVLKRPVIVDSPVIGIRKYERFMESYWHCLFLDDDGNWVSSTSMTREQVRDAITEKDAVVYAQVHPVP